MTTFNPEHVPDLLAPGGPLARDLAGYEDRPYQREMALEVARLLDGGGRMAIEAPTGIGKSLGYALPAAVWARSGLGPVVISTHTKALQGQLINQEAPRLARALGTPIEVAVMKGRTNYLCRRRYEVARSEATTQGTLELLEELETWVATTEDGDFGSSGVRKPRDLQYLAARVASEARNCAHSACTPATGCFFKLARARAAEAHLVIANHALLAIHLFGDLDLLPAFDALIVDEAHAFVKVALDHLSLSVGPGRVSALLEAGPGTRGAPPEMVRTGEGSVLLTELHRAVSRLELASRTWFGKTNGRRPQGESRQRYADPASFLRLTPNPLTPFSEAIDDARDRADTLRRHVGREGEGTEREEAFAQELARFREDLETLRRDLDSVTSPDPNARDTVTWKEWTGDDLFNLHASPLEAGPSIASALAEGPDRIVFTSATLAAGRDFEYFAREVGHAGALASVAYPTPFDFAEQALALAVRSGLDPRQPGWAAQTAGTLFRLATDPARKTMALFTSYRDLESVGEALRALDLPEDLAILVQGAGGTAADLLTRFKESPRALLLGTASFWEGVDLPGEDLEVLVLTRLPFGVPTDPRYQARSERLEAEGGNPFSRLYLPEAVLRFKQGAGRLIRRRTDRGIVAILDPRFATKSYGRKFQAALPMPAIPVVDADELTRRAAAWWRASAAGEEVVSEI